MCKCLWFILIWLQYKLQYCFIYRTLDSVYEKYKKESQMKEDDEDTSIIEIISPTVIKAKENKRITVKLRSRNGIKRFSLKSVGGIDSI